MKTMEYALAPMEGVTTYVYRAAFARYFGGIDRYYTPFLASMRLSAKDKNEVLPEHNAGIRLIPQILTNHADEFLAIAKALQAYGYQEVNLNLGCPSGTVASKHRGAGFLAVPEELDAFLQEIFAHCPIAISIKTRIGVRSEDEWERILAIYRKYPLAELIVHTRLQQDFYKKPARPHTFLLAQEQIDVPLCYNGDIDSVETAHALQERFPALTRMMLGRGLIADPNLIRRLRGLPCVGKETYAAFLDTLLSDYSRLMDGGERVILYRMKEIWNYLGDSFTDSSRYVKRIRKADRVADYELAVRQLLAEQELKER